MDSGKATCGFSRVPTTVTGGQDEEANAIIVCLPGDGLPGTTSAGLPLLVRVTGAQTRGRIGVVELDEAPRTEASIHVHNSDEAWYILSGEYKLFAGGCWYPAPQGTFIFVPGGIPHGFAVLPGTRARKLAFSLPAGLEETYVNREGDTKAIEIPKRLGIEYLPKEMT
jgi:quercetin dioxygenase-like cupin family protein